MLATTSLSLAQDFHNLSEEVPFDKSVRKGVLPNGLTYYIKHNEVPKDRASYYIIQNVGSVLENDDQNGLAHFLEHMAFNGTTTFPGNSMIDFLERNGIKFGKEINAYTAHNETVYNISKVPTINEKVVDSCLYILRDWCNGLTLTTKEIDAERGVIQEEWRSRLGLGTRISEQVNDIKYNHTIYANRPPIGSMDVVRNFDPETLRDFYHDWYRTDLQAVAIIGDFNVDEMEKRVIDLFSSIPAVDNPKKRKFINIPDNKSPLYTLGTDKELKNVNISLNIRHPEKSGNTLNDLRNKYINRFFNALMAGRYSEIKAKEDVPFLSGSVKYTNFVRGYKTFKITAIAEPSKSKEAFEAVYQELQRVVNHGFTAGEFERLKANMLVRVENNYLKGDKISSDSYAKALKSVYLDGASLTNQRFNYEFAKSIIPGITLKEVNDFMVNLLTEKNRVYIVTGPSNKKNDLPSLNELQKITSIVQKKKLLPFTDSAPIADNLLANEPIGGEVITEKPVDAFGATEWILSNGAKVVYRYADYQKNSVSLYAASEGGASVYGIEDIPSYSAASQYTRYFGIGELDPITYKKVMAGKTASSSFSIGDFTESVSGYSTTKDVETMMKLVYMRFEEPRFDKEKFNELLDRNRASVKNAVKSVTSFVKDTVNNIVNNGNPRMLKFDEKYLDQISFDRLKEIYSDRFSNAGDFTFFIVGDVQEEVIKPLVEKYIGAISDMGRNESIINHGNYFPKGKNEHKIMVKMGTPKSGVQIKMRTDIEYSREKIIYHSILGSILNLRFTENIREKEGGTYGVSVKSRGSRIPESMLSLDISFQCDPDRADYLKSLVYNELEKVKTHVRQDDLDKVAFNMKKNSEHSTESNRFWMNALRTYYRNGENMLASSYYDDIIDNVTPEDIENAAKTFLKDADVLDLMVFPKDTMQ
ncbi:zinc protease [Zhouia amylolytica]|uniref:Zinc protease n=2 Tax=Zhouia amylolytica TaxID=376730 RepID=A0A1I6VGM8_9FLAO|nr:zinc protease [Zhouia amylolytica]